MSDVIGSVSMRCDVLYVNLFWCECVSLSFSLSLSLSLCVCV